MNTVTKTYTVLELLRYLKDNMDTKTNCDSSFTSSKRWTGTDSFEDALQLLETGDDEITKKLKDATATKLQALNSKASSYIPDVQGAFFDVSKVLTGEPECYYKLSYEKTTRPRADLQVVINYSASTGVELLIDNASDLLVKIKQFELQGVEVRLSAITKSSHMTTGKYSNQTFIGIVLLKDYQDSINYRKLSGILHPSFNRRLLFRLKELTYPTTLSKTYGSPIIEKGDIRLDTNSSIKAIGEKNVITD